MQALKQVLPCAALLLLPACEPAPESQDFTPTTAASALTSVVSRGCTFTLSAQQRAGFPPQYDYVLTRQASASCPWAAASTTLGTSYTSGLALTGNDLGLAAAFTIKNTASGSSPVSVSLKHVAPDTLATVRTAGLSCGPSIYSVYLGNLSMPDGTTVQVDGTKGCAIYYGGEKGSGSSYTAYYFDFFTSTKAPAIFAY